LPPALRDHNVGRFGDGVEEIFAADVHVDIDSRA
jgi:hypothetical protein